MLAQEITVLIHKIVSLIEDPKKPRIVVLDSAHDGVPCSSSENLWIIECVYYRVANVELAPFVSESEVVAERICAR